MRMTLLLLLACIAPARAQVWHVDVDAAAEEADGLAWESAFQTMQPAVDAAFEAGGGQVWVAEGSYSEQRNNRTGSFELRPEVEVYGGFAGDETTLEQRDFVNRTTVIDGSAARGELPAIHVVLGADKARLDGFIIFGGSAQEGGGTDSGGGGMLNLNASPHVANCGFLYNEGFLGGAVLNAGSSPTFFNCNFRENAAPGFTGTGGAIASVQASPTFEKCWITMNTAAIGGAVHDSAGSSSSFLECAFESNTSRIDGGSIFTQESAVMLRDCTFTTNSSGNGGAISAATASTVSALRCAFDSNEADSGGALYASNASTMLFSECTFTSNSANLNGGAAYAEASSTLTFNGCDIQKNTAPNGSGGSIMSFIAGIVVDETSFGGNEAAFGGAVYLLAGQLNAATSTFTGNRALSRNGGALYADTGSDVIALDCDFLSNAAAGNGGAALIDSNAVFTGTLFEDNKGAFGGAINLGRSSNQQLLEGCAFVNNEASSIGGGLVALGANVRASSCVFSGNAAGDAGGAGAANVLGGVIDLVNCTFWGNTSTGPGGGVAADFTSTLTALNCIFAANAPEDIHVENMRTAAVTYSFVEEGWEGEGNFTGDPGLVFPERGDLRLLPSSPCRDSGSNRGASFDILNIRRPQGEAHDMGAYEFPSQDRDADGLPDAYEGRGDSDEDGVPDVEDVDSDNDGIPDGLEYASTLNPTDPSDAEADLDGDGLASIDEVLVHNTAPRNSDTDGDGLGDGRELDEGLDPLNPDTDGDGMPDGYEVTAGLNPQEPDADDDPDGDGLTNLDEAAAGSNPFDTQDPPSEVYVAVGGCDVNGLGVETDPWRTISHALNEVNAFATENHPVTVFAREGLYEERVQMVENATVIGAGPEATRIEHYDPNDREHVVIEAADNSRISGVRIGLPGLHPTVTVLVKIDDASMQVDNCVLDSGDNLFSIGLLIGGPDSSDTLVRDSVIQRVQYGVQAVDTAANITRNRFIDIRRDAIFIRLPETKNAKQHVETPVLGTNDISNTGLNQFRNVNGMLIQNASLKETVAQQNDWGAYSDVEVEAKLSGPVNFEPFLGKSIGPGSIVARVLGQDGAPVPASASPECSVPALGIAGALDPLSGNFVFTGVTEGKWMVEAKATGYASNAQQVAVGGLSPSAVELRLAPASGGPAACGNNGKIAYAGVFGLIWAANRSYRRKRRAG
jgi:hypothetical protein